MGESVKEALDKIRSMADTKTVIGEPINILENTTIIPVSKVSIGLGLGGGDYGKHSNSAGGGGTGLTVTPVAFLVISSTGETKLLNIGEGYASLGIMGTVNGIDAALDKAPDILGKLKALFKGDKSKNTDDKTDE